MAWITSKKSVRTGQMTYHVRFRIGGGREGKVETETFGGLTTHENLAEAMKFETQVEQAGDNWPQGWVKGVGFPVAEPEPEPEPEPPPEYTIENVGHELYENNNEISPGNRKRCKRQLTKLRHMEFQVNGKPVRPFDKPIDQITEDDIELWKREWPKAKTISKKTLSNHHGTLYSVFRYAMRKKIIQSNPCEYTSISRKLILMEQPKKRILYKEELPIILALATGELRAIILIALLTGMRYGEWTALMAQDIDFRKNEINIDKAWKAVGENGETAIPERIRKILKPKHHMRGHYLGVPKSLHSRRKLHMTPPLVAVFTELVKEKKPDDLIFTSPNGFALHHGDLGERLLLPFAEALQENGLEPFTMHGLRHTHASWMIAGGVTMPDLSRRLGHSNIATTIDIYWQEMQDSKDAIDRATAMAMADLGNDRLALAPIDPDLPEEIIEDDEDLGEAV